jgi:hypothetical protein
MKERLTQKGQSPLCMKPAILFGEKWCEHLVCRRFSQTSHIYPQSLPVRENREGFL